MPRKKLLPKVEAAILLKCRRRCAICFGINRDSNVKRGQIAHVDHDASNNDPGNLVFLCLEHHDLYDSSTRQSKGLTRGEVKVFRAEVEEAIAVALEAPISLQSEKQFQGEWDGVYRRESDNASAEFQINALANGRYRVTGIAFWDTHNLNGPNLGEIESEAEALNGTLVVRAASYELVLIRTATGLAASEGGTESPFGLNVSFAGTYTRVPRGADALAQPTMRSFESQFWPEEGRPVYRARGRDIVLRARPSLDAPVIAEWNVKPHRKIAFEGFRYKTIRPGVLLASRPGVLEGRNLGNKDYVSRANYYEDGGEPISLSFGPGDRIDYLQYRAEGTGFFRWQGLVIDAHLPWIAHQSPLNLVTAPVAESWVRVSQSRGGLAGWVLADEYLDEVDRTF